MGCFLDVSTLIYSFKDKDRFGKNLLFVSFCEAFLPSINNKPFPQPLPGKKNFLSEILPDALGVLAFFSCENNLGWSRCPTRVDFCTIFKYKI